MAGVRVKTARPTPKSVDYVETLMYGRYQKDLGEFARQEAARIKALQERRRKKHPFKQYQPSKWDPVKRRCSWLRYLISTKIGDDWIFLTLLGVVMALLSFIMDYAIEKCLEAYEWMYAELSFSPPLQFFAWILFPLVFICFSTGFVHIVGPNAIGSGIPEMKTILRGVVLKEYLTLRTLISKMVGLCSSLGSGLLIGKEGPFVHVASIAATLLGKLISSFHGIYENESRNSEMLAAACAVGVACTFAAPIGGVLFSIEVTATYFAVRNYWRGFYSAVCGAFVFRLLAIFFKNEETLTALFKTNFRHDFPFDPIELFAFALIGLLCGFAGALFVYTHRKIVEFIRGQRKMSSFLQKNRFIFPGVIVLVLSSLTCPLGLGQFMAGDLTNGKAVNMLFSNMTWALSKNVDIADDRILRHWSGPNHNLFVTLTLFILMRFWMSALAITLPVPAGVFMPVFTIGAAFGRLIGESMAMWFPAGIGNRPIVPGGYAIVGAAALSGSVTHTISTSVIVFELTGQIGHVLPAVIAVLISNAVAHCLQLSIYDSLIQIKKLPYLPDIINAKAINAHNVKAEDFMVTKVNCLTVSSTYLDMYELLQMYDYRSYPLVESEENMLLLGSVQRLQLEQRLDSLLTPGPNMTFIPDALPRPGFITYDDSAPPSPLKVLPQTTAPAASEPPSELHAGEETAHLESVSITESETPPGQEEPLSIGSKRSFRFSVSRVDKPAASPTSPTLPPVDEQKADSPRPLKGILKNPEPEKTETAIDDVDANSFLDLEMISHWERIQLGRPIDFSLLTIDAAPFQLVPQTSLYKIHTIFSLLSLNHAYVTSSGKLVGVIGLKEVREAVQGQVNSVIGSFKAPRPHGTPSQRKKRNTSHQETEQDSADSEMKSSDA